MTVFIPKSQKNVFIKILSPPRLSKAPSHANALSVRFVLTDGVSAEPLHLPGGYVHRQLWAVGECRPDPLQSGVRLPEHYFDIENHSGTSNFQVLKKEKVLFKLRLGNDGTAMPYKDKNSLNKRRKRKK